MTEQATEVPEVAETTSPFDRGLELYEQKAPYNEVIDEFERGAAQAPKDSSGYTCLAWLYLLRNENEDAEKAYQLTRLGIKLDRTNAQAHFNMVLAMLVTKRKGIREEVQKAMQKCKGDDLKDAIDNLKDALERRPDFEDARKLLNWLI